MQGDVGFWLVFKNYTEEKATLLLQGEWKFHYDYLFARNKIIDINELKVLDNLNFANIFF